MVKDFYDYKKPGLEKTGPEKSTERISSERPKFADFNSTAKIYCDVFKSKSSLRHYVFYSKTNGLDQVISRLGKKLIFDLNKLDQWIAQGGGK